MLPSLGSKRPSFLQPCQSLSSKNRAASLSRQWPGQAPFRLNEVLASTQGNGLLLSIPRPPDSLDLRPEPATQSVMGVRQEESEWTLLVMCASHQPSFHVTFYKEERGLQNVKAGAPGFCWQCVPGLRHICAVGSEASLPPLRKCCLTHTSLRDT